MKTHQIRQGDVFLLQVKVLPEDCKAIQPENGTRFVLAHENGCNIVNYYNFTRGIRATGLE